MSDLAGLLATPPVPPVQCKLCRLLADHPEADVIRKAIADQRWSSGALSRVLTHQGVPVGESSVKRHRHNCEKHS